MKKHINIPIFIPMMGCPFACIYCSQVEISGHIKPDFTKVDDEINLALKFGDQFYKQLNLIYMKPDNETNQYKLLKEIISKCDYITSCSVGDPEKDKELSELIEKKKKGNK